MGAPPPPPPPPPFGGGAPGVPPGYGNLGGPSREHPDGTTVLILGILGIAVCGLLSPIAWVKGGQARREMAAQPNVTWSNQSSVTAGWICGIVGTVLIGLALLAFLLFVVLLVAAG